jgi:hypothetical protein
MEKYFFVKVPTTNGFNHYIRMDANGTPEVVELTQNEANKRSYEERVLTMLNPTQEQITLLQKVFPHNGNFT